MRIEASGGHRILWDVIPGNEYAAGMKIPGPPGTTITYEGSMESRSVDIPAVYEFVIQFGAGASSTVVATWLIDKFRGRAQKIEIDRREVDLNDEGQVVRIVEEKIKVRAVSRADPEADTTS